MTTITRENALPELERAHDMLEALSRRVTKLEAAAEARAAAPPVGGVASDADLDSQYGDPEIRFDPRRWTGPTMAGRRYSQTSPEYLDCVAEFEEWKASRPLPGKENDARYSAQRASRARGWAARLRAGYVAEATHGEAKSLVDAIPF